MKKLESILAKVMRLPTKREQSRQEAKSLIIDATEQAILLRVDVRYSGDEKIG